MAAQGRVAAQHDLEGLVCRAGCFGEVLADLGDEGSGFGAGEGARVGQDEEAAVGGGGELGAEGGVVPDCEDGDGVAGLRAGWVVVEGDDEGGGGVVDLGADEGEGVVGS